MRCGPVRGPDGAAVLLSVATTRQFQPSGRQPRSAATPRRTGRRRAAGRRATAAGSGCPRPHQKPTLVRTVLAIAYSWETGGRAPAGDALASGSAIGWAYWVNAANIESISVSPMTAGPCSRHDAGVAAARDQTERTGPLTTTIPEAAKRQVGQATGAPRPRPRSRTSSATRSRAGRR